MRGMTTSWLSPDWIQSVQQHPLLTRGSVELKSISKYIVAAVKQKTVFEHWGVLSLFNPGERKRVNVVHSSTWSGATFLKGYAAVLIGAFAFFHLLTWQRVRATELSRREPALKRGVGGT